MAMMVRSRSAGKFSQLASKPGRNVGRNKNKKNNNNNKKPNQMSQSRQMAGEKKKLPNSPRNLNITPGTKT